MTLVHGLLVLQRDVGPHEAMASDSSFDVGSQIDRQEMVNAVDQ